MALEKGDVRIRLAVVDDAPGLARVHVRTWQSAYRGILPDSFLDGLEPTSREERWREILPLPERFTYAAERSRASGGLPAEIIGFSSGGRERDGLTADGITYDGEVYAIYLAPEHQRQGIGRQLIAASARHMIESGTKSIVIWALKDNKPARAFYEALGGVPAGEKTVTIGPSSLVDVAYGWPDARVLLRRADQPSRARGADGRADRGLDDTHTL